MFADRENNTRREDKQISEQMYPENTALPCAGFVKESFSAPWPSLTSRLAWSVGSHLGG